jgi:hypothetical protein
LAANAPITTATGGPATFINTDPDSPTGWLVPPDDLDATVAALTAAVANEEYPDEAVWKTIASDWRALPKKTLMHAAWAEAWRVSSLAAVKDDPHEFMVRWVRHLDGMEVSMDEHIWQSYAQAWAEGWLSWTPTQKEEARTVLFTNLSDRHWATTTPFQVLALALDLAGERRADWVEASVPVFSAWDPSMWQRLRWALGGEPEAPLTSYDVDSMANEFLACPTPAAWTAHNWVGFDENLYVVWDAVRRRVTGNGNGWVNKPEMWPKEMQRDWLLWLTAWKMTTNGSDNWAPLYDWAATMAPDWKREEGRPRRLPELLAKVLGAEGRSVPHHLRRMAGLYDKNKPRDVRDVLEGITVKGPGLAQQPETDVDWRSFGLD